MVTVPTTGSPETSAVFYRDVGMRTSTRHAPANSRRPKLLLDMMGGTEEASEEEVV